MPARLQNNPVVANNTPLVALSVLERLDLLRELFGGILIPESVQQEFLATEEIARKQALENSPWIQADALEYPRRALAFTGLDRGEAEVLALAEEREARLVIIDERRGRAYARRLGLPLTGTIGVLLLGKERGLIDAIKPLLNKLLDAGLYLSPDLVAHALDRAGES
jgi:hypothetical protein